MCVFHILSLQTTYVHIARCFIQLERRNVPLSFGIKKYLFVWPVYFDSSSKLGYFEQNAGLGQAHPQKQLAVKVLTTVM